MTTSQATKPKALVLYVDDESSNRLVFKHSFEPEFEVILAENAEQATAVLAEHPIAIVVTDQRMPGKSGMDLLETIKSSHPRVIRMVVTAYSDLDPILRAVNEGLVARYLMKPWDYAELRGALHWGAEIFRTSEEDEVLAARVLKTERMATLGTLAASLVHDLRQPLSYMRYNVDRLIQLKAASPAILRLLDAAPNALSAAERKAVESLTTELDELAADINSGTVHISDLLRDLASWISPARMEGARIPEAVQVIRFAASLCRTVTQRARVGVTYQGPERLENLALEASELTQILVNLITNATQAIEGASQVGGAVVIRAKVDGRQVTLTVQDNGPGMSAETLEKLGSLFFSTRPGGTGLGLNQCFRLVSRAGGDIRIESKEGEGTSVHLHLIKIIEG